MMRVNKQAYTGLILALLVLVCFSTQDVLAQNQMNITERMASEHKGDRPVRNASSDINPSMEVTSEWVTYAMEDEDAIQGYFVHPKKPSKHPRPGIIVIHEWWGLNSNIEMMARRLAGEGYQTLAVDLYRGDTAATAEGARKLMRQAMNSRPAKITNLKQAYQYLNKKQNAPKTGVIGWCFGGGWSLQTALALPERIEATVIYYGRLVTEPQRLKTLQMPVMGNFGSEDDAIPPSQVRRFESVMDSLGKTVDVKIYEGANHAFANPSGDSYVKDAAMDAWKRTISFFDKYLK